MRIAVPTANEKLCQHFGHCEVFTFIDVDEETRTIKNVEEIVPPEHIPGVIPPWVAEQGATVVLAGGMGARAVQLFEMANIDVLTGCLASTPREAAEKYLAGTLEQGINGCSEHSCGEGGNHHHHG